MAMIGRPAPKAYWRWRRKFRFYRPCANLPNAPRARVGLPNWVSRLTRKTAHLARLYLDALGFPDAEPLPVLSWDDALDAAESGDLNSEGWEAEEQLRAALTDRVLAGVSEDGLGVMLAHLSAALAEPLAEMADEALMMADEPPDAIRDLAVGAAQQAAFGGALAGVWRRRQTGRR